MTSSSSGPGSKVKTGTPRCASGLTPRPATQWLSQRPGRSLPDRRGHAPMPMGTDITTTSSARSASRTRSLLTGEWSPPSRNRRPCAWRGPKRAGTELDAATAVPSVTGSELSRPKTTRSPVSASTAHTHRARSDHTESNIRSTVSTITVWGTRPGRVRAASNNPGRNRRGWRARAASRCGDPVSENPPQAAGSLVRSATRWGHPPALATNRWQVGETSSPTRRATMSAGAIPARSRAPVSEPMEVPIMRSASRGSQPHSQSAASTPAWKAWPTGPPAPRISATRGCPSAGSRSAAVSTGEVTGRSEHSGGAPRTTGQPAASPARPGAGGGPPPVTWRGPPGGQPAASGRRSAGGVRAEGHLHRYLLHSPHQPHFQGGAGRHGVQGGKQVGGAAEVAAAGADQEIAPVDAGGRRRAAFLHRPYQQALPGRKPDRLPQAPGRLCGGDGHAQVVTQGALTSGEGVHPLPQIGVGRDRQVEAVAQAVSVDPDQGAPGIHQGTARRAPGQGHGVLQSP